jgi:hypothetical protein
MDAVTAKMVRDAAKAAKPKTKRKPSAYNLFVQKSIKAGMTMAQAAAAFKAQKK